MQSVDKQVGQDRATEWRGQRPEVGVQGSAVGRRRSHAKARRREDSESLRLSADSLPSPCISNLRSQMHDQRAIKSPAGKSDGGRPSTRRCGCGEAVFAVEPLVELRESNGMCIHDLRKAQALAVENKELIMRRWYEYRG